MILELYRQLEEIGDSEYSDIIEESEIIFSYTGRARKLRLKLIDNTFIDIWHSQEGEYSFHREQRDIRNTIYRHDTHLIRGGLLLKPSQNTAMMAFKTMLPKAIFPIVQMMHSGNSWPL